MVVLRRGAACPARCGMFGIERQILHLRVASFPVAVYRVKDPSLRDRPLVVSAGRGARAVVVSLSGEARGEGIRRGMMLAEARRRCRRLLALPPDPFLFDRAGRALAEILARFSPMVEPAGLGRFFLDLTGTGRLLGPAVDTTRRIQVEIAGRLRLGPGAGIGVNKLVSGVAARVILPPRSRDLIDVAPGSEEGFLAPLAVRHLPAVDPATEGRLLDDLNIRRIRQLRAIDLMHLSLAFRGKGIVLYRQSRGIDESPVRPPDRALSVEEDETLPDDTNDDAVLLGCLFGMLERAGARLRRLGRLAGEVRFAARYSDGMAVSRVAPIAPPSWHDAALWDHVRPLFDRVVERRGRVRYMMLRFTKLGEPAAQMSLFVDPHDPREAGAGRGSDLTAALDRIRGRFGTGAVVFGRRVVMPREGDDRTIAGRCAGAIGPARAPGEGPASGSGGRGWDHAA